MFQRKHIGHGLGLRKEHFQAVLESPPQVDWFEVITENYLVDGGRPLDVLEKVRGKAPIVLHGVSLCIGNAGPLNREYLERVCRLADWIKPAWISDHLCWGRFDGDHYGHDLWPLPMTREALQLCADHVKEVQDCLGRNILLENVSSYVTFAADEMSEAAFLGELAERADCGLLLDVNNVYVSAFNHGFDPVQYIQQLPADRVGQIHLAGHQDHGVYLFDAHDRAVIDPVWDLLRVAYRHCGQVSTLIERDENIPDFAELVAESKTAAGIEGEVIGGLGTHARTE